MLSVKKLLYKILQTLYSKQYEVTTQSVTISANTDYILIDARSGWHLVNAMISTTHVGVYDVVTGIVWASATKYGLIMKGAPTSAKTMTAKLTWVKA